MNRPRYDLTTLGETMIRIGVGPGVPLENATAATLHAGGAESNVTCALASLDRRVAWASRLPDSATGRFVAGALRRCGVDLSHVHWCDAGRVGAFYLESAPPPSPVRVTYDRADSCASAMTPDTIDWPGLLDTRLLHLTGITPALSPACLETTRVAIARARAAGVPVSFDLNYRRKLWSADVARQTLEPLMQDVELLFIAQADARDVLGITGSAAEQLKAIRARTLAKHIILSVGDAGVHALRDGDLLHEAAWPVTILDRIGAGDALAAGVIDGWLDNDFAAGLRRGTALAAMCLQRLGDIITSSRRELDAFGSAGDRPTR